MNTLNRISIETENDVVLRAASHFEKLKDLFFKENAGREWATFAKFGWRATADVLVLTLADLTLPETGNVEGGDHRVTFHAPYMLKTALAAESHKLAIGVIHSHPKNAPPLHSEIDDDMDAYFLRYFDDFAPDRPYVSIIMSEMADKIALSGRVYWKAAGVL